MDVTIVTIGDELLIGQVVDTNSAWMAKKLNNVGFNVKQIWSVSDAADAITSAVDSAMKSTDIVLLTGGLGPTKDDITKATLAAYFNTKLVYNDGVLKNVEQLLLHRLHSLNRLNRSQAMVPEACRVMINEFGTAPAMWFEKDGKVVVSMAGVPFEMQHSMEKDVIPGLIEKFRVGKIVHKTLLVTGYAESVLSEKIEDIENGLPFNIKLAYLPSPGLVRLRLSASGEAHEELETAIQKEVEKLYDCLQDAIQGEDDDNLEQGIGVLLKKHGLLLGTAESCTGGNIAAQIISVAGSSDYFSGAIVAYQNEIKVNVLGVSPSDLQKEGAVSEAVVVQMVKGALNALNCQVAIATSGIAGPSGGTDEKPVGTVWVAVGNKNKVLAKKYVFTKNRTYNIKRSTLTGLMMLKEFVLHEYRNV